MTKFTLGTVKYYSTLSNYDFCAQCSSRIDGNQSSWVCPKSHKCSQNPLDICFSDLSTSLNISWFTIPHKKLPLGNTLNHVFPKSNYLFSVFYEYSFFDLWVARPLTKHSGAHISKKVILTIQLKNLLISTEFQIPNCFRKTAFFACK